MEFVSVSFNGSGSIGVNGNNEIVVVDGKKFVKVASYGDNGLEYNLYPFKG